MKKMVMITGLLISFFMMRSIEAMLPNNYDEQEVILGNIDAAEYLQRFAQSNDTYNQKLNFIIKRNPQTYGYLVASIKEYIMENEGDSLDELAQKLSFFIRSQINLNFTYIKLTTKY